MSVRELLVLSPYRVPAQNALMLGAEDVAAFLNAHAALWHPAALQGAAGPPQIASPYDHEEPAAGRVFAVPETPPVVLPDDWDRRVRDAGAVAFRATPDRAATLANLREALAAAGAAPALLDLPAERLGPFFGVGFGLRMVETLFEAMDHENVLAAVELWQDVQDALAALGDADPDAFRRPLQAAAEKLLAAREVLYPVSLHLLDLCLPAADGSLRLPASFDKRLPVNVLASSATLERLDPELLRALGARVREELAEVCGGSYLEREDALLPLESQLWNLLKGLRVAQALLDQEVQVFARRRFGFHPQTPLFLQSVGLRRAILLPFDESAVPTYNATVVNWPSPDGKQVEAFTRPPYPAGEAQTYFHWAHYLHKSIAQDHAATLALLHRSEPAAPFYDDLLELSRLAPVLGQWTTLSRYFNDVMAGEYTSAPPADDFHGDYLNERTEARRPDVVSGFARQARLRRRIDTAWTLAALCRGLMGRNDPLRLDAELNALEDRLESAGEGEKELAALERRVGEALAGRLLSRAVAETPGYLILNPCGFTRRVVVDLPDVAGPLPLGGPLKAFQPGGDRARGVVEVPGLGFAWVPQSGPPGMPAPAARMRMADEAGVRNEFLEADIDPQTGGLRGLRDPRTRASRIGQQLVFNPGSTMRATAVRVLSNGPALGEVVTEGELLDAGQQVLARFRQFFRVWLTRPVLELRIELIPEHRPEGYPWHNYYGARFAWRDERAVLLRGVNGMSYATTATRPETPDFLELRTGRTRTAILPGGLPFHQRHGGRMLDVILVPPGEAAQAFDLALALDREYPMQTALGTVSPATVVPVAKGPPHVGAVGWLFHLDAPNLLLTSLRPLLDGADGVVARLIECANHTAPADLRCVRDPRHASLVDAQGLSLHDATVSGDAVQFELAPGDLAHLRVDFE